MALAAPMRAADSSLKLKKLAAWSRGDWPKPRSGSLRVKSIRPFARAVNPNAVG